MTRILHCLVWRSGRFHEVLQGSVCEAADGLMWAGIEAKPSTMIS